MRNQLTPHYFHRGMMEDHAQHEADQQFLAQRDAEERQRAQQDTATGIAPTRITPHTGENEMSTNPAPTDQHTPATSAPQQTSNGVRFDADNAAHIELRDRYRALAEKVLDGEQLTADEQLEAHRITEFFIDAAPVEVEARRIRELERIQQDFTQKRKRAADVEKLQQKLADKIAERDRIVAEAEQAVELARGELRIACNSSATLDVERQRRVHQLFGLVVRDIAHDRGMDLPNDDTDPPSVELEEAMRAAGDDYAPVGGDISRQRFDPNSRQMIGRPI